MVEAKKTPKDFQGIIGFKKVENKLFIMLNGSDLLNVEESTDSVTLNKIDTLQEDVCADCNAERST